MPGSPSYWRVLPSLGIALVVLYVGWREFWFLTDDAFIIFRYAGNFLADRGAVWNPPPFLPVDGVTEFLWGAILTAIWAGLGIEPPDAANFLALLFAAGTVVLTAALVWRMPLPPRLERGRGVLVGVVLVGVVTNRVFLAASSSGLGTALVNFCWLWWLFYALAPRRSLTPGWVFGLAASAACSALARPDGYLIVMATLVLLGRRAWLERSRVSLATILAALPLLLVPAHLVWRRIYYGAWMPNPYYAKNAGPWPESGVRYLASFVVEYSIWLFVLVALAWLAVRLRRPLRAGAHCLTRGFEVTVAVATVLAHFAYYTFVIGGDHFEYRVYSHLIPLLLIAFVAMVAALPRPGAAVALLGTFVVLMQPIAWFKYAQHDRPLVPALPAALRPVLAPYDAWQEWLNRRFVCVRHASHRSFWQDKVEQLPSRAAGLRLVWDDRPVIADGCVGVLGWVLPNVAIIDTLGLNDWVVARNPVGSEDEVFGRRRQALAAAFDLADGNGDDRVSRAELETALARMFPDLVGTPARLAATVATYMGACDRDGDSFIQRAEVMVAAAGHRQMAHDRFPPPGYVAGFRPNVVIENGEARVISREAPLRDAEIRAHEASFGALVGAPR